MQRLLFSNDVHEESTADNLSQLSLASSSLFLRITFFIFPYSIFRYFDISIHQFDNQDSLPGSSYDFEMPLYKLSSLPT